MKSAGLGAFAITKAVKGVPQEKPYDVLSRRPTQPWRLSTLLKKRKVQANRAHQQKILVADIYQLNRVSNQMIQIVRRDVSLSGSH
jgi:hypothetical protein